MIGDRIRQLRLARGLSLEGLAIETGNIVTKQAISKYEKGRSVPSNTVLLRLAQAFGVKAAFLLSEPDIEVEFVAYRKTSKLTKKEQQRIQSIVQGELEDRVALANLLETDAADDVPVMKHTVRQVADAERASDQLRKEWDLGMDPIPSVCDALEEHHIHVLQLDTERAFDGISAIAKDGQEIKAAAVVTRKGLPGERQRLSLAHELGHIVLRIQGNANPEKCAFRFGAAFLAPKASVLKEVGSSRSHIQSQELLLLKKRFGMSIQAILYRLSDLKVIKPSYYRQWCIDINRLGWRDQEPFELPPESPTWLRQNALRVFSEGAISIKDAGRLLGESLGVEPTALLHRSELAKLPNNKRRSLLALQADQMIDHYKAERRSQLQEGDFTEYS